MNRRQVVLGTAAVSAAVFAGGVVIYSNARDAATRETAQTQAAALVNFHSPVEGPPEAPVTVVEFFDPSCETCRAFYPIVKQIMQLYPTQVRLVLRYAPFHEGSDTVVRMLEAARRQDLFTPVLEALLSRQPEWAKHDGPDLELAWTIAGSAGLDLTRARTEAQLAEIDAVLASDLADAEALGVRQTPGFFVNGRPLTEFGPQQLYDLVSEEVQKTGDSNGIVSE